MTDNCVELRFISVEDARTLRFTNKAIRACERYQQLLVYVDRYVWENEQLSHVLVESAQSTSRTTSSEEPPSRVVKRWWDKRYFKPTGDAIETPEFSFEDFDLLLNTE